MIRFQAVLVTLEMIGVIMVRALGEDHSKITQLIFIMVIGALGEVKYCTFNG